MKAEDFAKKMYKEADKDYGLCQPPLEAQIGMNILIEHFLGEEWYVAMPISTKQVNAEAVYKILEKYPKKKSFKDRLSSLVKHNK